MALHLVAMRLVDAYDAGLFLFLEQFVPLTLDGDQGEWRLFFSVRDAEFREIFLRCFYFSLNETSSAKLNAAEPVQLTYIRAIWKAIYGIIIEHMEHRLRLIT